MCLSDNALDWRPPCPKCGKRQLVVLDPPEFPGYTYATTMTLVCPDWPQRCDMRKPER